MRPAPGFLHNTTFLLKPEKIILRLIAIVFINGAYIKVNAQGGESQGGGCNSLISSYCSYDLTDTIPGLTIDSTSSTSQISYGIINANLKDVLYEKDMNKCDTSYHLGDDCIDGLGSLTFYVYYPQKLNGNPITCKLPVIINFHGGSYFECSVSTHPGAKDICRRLAKRGFVVINAEYRRGVILDKQRAPNLFQEISVQQVLAIYRANQDIRGCIRSAIKMQRMGVNGFGTTFNIDTTRIFVAGQSAGAVMAMGAAYYERQEQIDSALSSGNANLRNALGRLDAPWYYGDTTINYKPLVKGVLAMWGGLPVHRSFYSNTANYFNTNTVNPPLIGFTGKKDSTFPPGKNYFYFSTTPVSAAKYKTESLCLVGTGSYSNPDDVPNPMDPTVNADAVCVGIDTLHATFKRIGKYSEVYVDCQMGHGLDPDSVGVTYKSEFGTGAMTQTDVINYIAGRAATYFAAIMNASTYPLSLITRTRFIECSNSRSHCDVPGDTSTGCLYLPTVEDSASCPGP